MSCFSARRRLAVALALLMPALAARAQAPAAPEDSEPVATANTITVTATPSARNLVAPDSGATQYSFSDADIARLPQGDATPMNQVLLQAPGIVQDGFGQVHVRGDHGNLQYRVNGVMIPESLGGFGQMFDTRMADKLTVLTGALPAQYGYRTAGVVDIRTRGPESEPGGEFSVQGGSRNYGETGAVANGSVGRFSYNLTGSLMTSQQGIDNPANTLNAAHDLTRQGKGFGFLAYDIDPQQRLSLMFGQSQNQFQIPDNPGLVPQCCSSTLTPTPGPLGLNAAQGELNVFQVASYQSQGRSGVDTQVSFYHRLSQLSYMPDPALGDLFYTGVSNAVVRRNEAQGVQSDFGYALNDRHKLHATLMVQQERYLTDSTSQVYCLGVSLACAGNQLDPFGVASTPPATIVDNTNGISHFWGMSLQDEWKYAQNLTFNYGLRYDQNSFLVNEHQVSPRFSLVYDWSPVTRFHAGYASYFTPPPAEIIDTRTVSLFNNTTNASPVAANSPVRSERSDYLDMGLSRRWSDELTLGVDAYYRKVQHLLDEGQFGNALIFSGFNYQEGRIYGIEFSGTWRRERWTGALNAAVGRAQGRGIESGQFNFPAAELAYINSHWVYLDHDQRYTMSGSVGYRTDWANLTADALFGSGLRSGFANTQTMPAYVTVNTAATHLFKTGFWGDLEGRLSVLNVFDHSYELRDGTGIGVGAPQYGLRRTLIVGVTRFF
ncbi:MAG: TonB-dependent receptor [Betaproteobacteria bacterium]|nr:TonB-dependent receptor [Betaproteobacteria bacterium]